MKKKKIWSSISRFAMAFMFIASWAVLGVALALKSAKVEIGGGITFTATNEVYATIIGSVAGTKTANTLNSITIDADTQESFTTPTAWSNMTLDFKDASTPIVVTITIENLSTERDLWLVIADNIESYGGAYVGSGSPTHNTSVTRMLGSSTMTTLSDYRYSTIEVQKGHSITIDTKLNIYDKNNSVNDDFKLGIELIDESSIKNATEYSKLSFTTNTSTKKASVSKANTSISGEVVIPALVKSEDEIYTVTSIGSFSGCTQMTSLSIPASITAIGSNAFENCTSVNSVSIACYVGWFNGNSALYDLPPTSTSIPDALNNSDHPIRW